MKPLYPFNIELKNISDTKIGLVSVITRTKNRPQFLQRSLKSVRDQKYPNWEHIIVNDGGSAEEVNNIISNLTTEQREKIKIIHLSKSKGMEAASNAGLAIATGEYFTIHDDDDTWHEDFLINTVEYLCAQNNKKLVAVTSNCEIILEEEVNGLYKTTEKKDWPHWSNQIQLLDLLARNTIPTIALLIRRSVLTLTDGYAEEMPVLGDWDFNIRLLLLGDIGTIDKKLAFYHQRSTTNSSASNSISGSISLHHEYWQKYRNSLTRKSITENPAIIGTLNPILTKIDELKQLQSKLIQEATTEALQREIQNLEIRLHHATKKNHESLSRDLAEIKESILTIKHTLHPLQKLKAIIRKIITKLSRKMS